MKHIKLNRLKNDWEFFQRVAEIKFGSNETVEEIEFGSNEFLFISNSFVNSRNIFRLR